MTTNVLDCIKGMLCSDSRWSSDNGDWIAYVDNTNYDKLAYTSKVGFLFAGDMPPIDAWKTYVSAGMKKGQRPAIGLGNIPGTRLQVMQVELSSGRIVFQSHQFARSSFGVATKALFAGTGAEFAKTCWDVNKCPTTAVISAAKSDVRSGGNVVFLNRTTRQTNVTNTASAESLVDQLKNRGFLMNATQNQSPISLKDAANDPSNPAGQAFAKAVMSGAAPLTAPFQGMDEPWTKEKIAEFDAALSEFEED